MYITTCPRFVQSPISLDVCHTIEIGETGVIALGGYRLSTSTRVGDTQQPVWLESSTDGDYQSATRPPANPPRAPSPAPNAPVKSNAKSMTAAVTIPTPEY